MKPKKRRVDTGESALPPIPILIGFAIFCLSTALVIYGLTTYTFNLDDIKILGLHMGGALSLLTWAVLWLRGDVANPPRLVIFPYLVYLVVCLLSLLMGADYVKWVGWEFLGFYVSCLGLILLGSGVIQSRRMVELSLKFWVFVAFTTTAFGLIHYAGLLEPIYQMLYPQAPAQPSKFHDLIFTFMRNRSMLSTILNVQFFGVFLLMLLPVCAAALVIVFQNLRRRMEAGSSIWVPMTWMIVCGLSIVFAIACVFTTFSKSALIFLPVSIGGFLLGLALITKVRQVPHFGVMTLLGVLMAGTILFFTMGDLKRNFQNIDDSMGPRTVIFSGAIAIFKDNPVLGTGPGSFRVVFPAYRSPDYHMVRISNVTLYAHNWFLDHLSETGFLGAFSYLAFLGGLFWLAFLAIRRGSDVAYRVAALGCLIGVVSILGGTLLNPMTRWPVGLGSLHAMLGTLLGVSAFALRRVEEEVTAGAASVGKPLKIATVCAAAVFMVLASNVAIKGFHGAYLHNEGMRRSELNPGLFDRNGEVLPQAVPIVRQAAELYERSLAIRPGSPTTYYKLAHVYNQLGQPERSLQTYRDLQRIAPDYSEIHYNIAVIYYTLAGAERQRMNTFIGMLQNPETRPPDVVDPQAEYERSLAATREFYKKSVDSFQRAAELSNKVSVHYFYGATLQLYAQLFPAGSDEGREIFRRAGEVLVNASELPISRTTQTPDQQYREREQRHTAMRAARDVFESAGEFERAAIQGERYFRRNPRSREDLERAATLYIRADRTDDAIRLVDEALGQNPLNPDIQILKMNLYTRAGRPADAARQARFLLALDDQMKESGQPFLNTDIRNNVMARAAANQGG